MSIIEKIIEQHGADSTTVQVMQQFFPVIEKAEAVLQLQDRKDVLRDVLKHYADQNNWEKDEFGISRIWREPDSTTPESYDGFNLALTALAQDQEAIDHTRRIEGEGDD